VADAAKVLKGRIQGKVGFDVPWKPEDRHCACCGGTLHRRIYFPADGSGPRCADCGPKIVGVTNIGNDLMLTRERLRNKHRKQADMHEQYQRAAWKDERKYYKETGRHSWDG
jgi:hypothetical protein